MGARSGRRATWFGLAGLGLGLALGVVGVALDLSWLVVLARPIRGFGTIVFLVGGVAWLVTVLVRRLGAEDDSSE